MIILSKFIAIVMAIWARLGLGPKDPGNPIDIVESANVMMTKWRLLTLILIHFCLTGFQGQCWGLLRGAMSGQPILCASPTLSNVAKSVGDHGYPAQALWQGFGEIFKVPRFHQEPFETLFLQHKAGPRGMEFQCQHGPTECEGNKVHACAAQHIGGKGSKLIEYIRYGLSYVRVRKPNPDPHFQMHDCRQLWPHRSWQKVCGWVGHWLWTHPAMCLGQRG